MVCHGGFNQSAEMFVTFEYTCSLVMYTYIASAGVPVFVS